MKKVLIFLLCASASSLFADVLISELTYDAKKPFKSDDWVEICNYGTETVDISNWVLGDEKYDEGGTTFTIPEGTTLAPKECIVIYTAVDFLSIYPNVTNAFGPSGIGFGKSEDAYVLLDKDGKEQCVIEYSTISDGGEWPDGSAYSNVLVFPYGNYPNTWQSWSVSNVEGGSPGVYNEETSSLYISKHSRNPNAPTSTTAPEVHIWAGDYAASSGKPTSVSIFYTTSPSGSYTKASMTLVEGEEYKFTFPVLEEGTTVFYYFVVTDAAGNSLYRYWNVEKLPYMYIVTNSPVYTGVVINEIMYNSLDTAFTNSEGKLKGYEFVELYNRTDAAIDVSYWRFETKDFKMRLPADITLGAGAYLLITDRSEALETVYNIPSSAQIFEFDFDLGNGKDSLSLQNANGQEVDVVAYTDSSPWPTTPDGKGPSLELLDPFLDNSKPAAWAASIATYGTPGEENSVPEPAFALLCLLAIATLRRK